ncbi:MAG TPA: hypothetical protein VIK73_05115 [Limnochordales bacterium]
MQPFTWQQGLVSVLPVALALAMGARLIWSELGPLVESARRAQTACAAWTDPALQGLARRWRGRLALLYGLAAGACVAWAVVLLLTASQEVRAALISALG